LFNTALCAGLRDIRPAGNAHRPGKKPAAGGERARHFRDAGAVGAVVRHPRFARKRGAAGGIAGADSALVDGLERGNPLDSSGLPHRNSAPPVFGIKSKLCTFTSMPPSNSTPRFFCTSSHEVSVSQRSACDLCGMIFNFFWVKFPAACGDPKATN
jgi:hypothetical protein